MARIRAFGKPGCHSSIATVSTWYSVATITTTKEAGRCEAASMTWAGMRSAGATVDTCRPMPVMTAAPADGAFDTSARHPFHLILGGGARTHHRIPMAAIPRADCRRLRSSPTQSPIPGSAPGVFVKHGADAWKCRLVGAPRHNDGPMGSPYFDLDPGAQGGKPRSRSATIMPWAPRRPRRQTTRCSRPWSRQDRRDG